MPDVASYTIDDMIAHAAVAHDSLHGPLGTGARVSADVIPPQGIKTHEDNTNPVVTPDGVPTFPDPVRRSDFNDRPSLRGYIVMFLNPWQFWRDTHNSSGKLELPAPLATMMTGGLLPNTPQRANIRTPEATSWGDHVTRTAESLGIDPYSGW
jgi:hypothetical protein